MGHEKESIVVHDNLPNLSIELGDVPTTKNHQRPHSGDLCPVCGIGHLDYDGLLNLSCPKCGVTASGGCFT
jgi:hypothetical protein